MPPLPISLALVYAFLEREILLVIGILYYLFLIIFHHHQPSSCFSHQHWNNGQISTQECLCRSIYVECKLCVCFVSDWHNDSIFSCTFPLYFAILRTLFYGFLFLPELENFWNSLLAHAGSEELFWNPDWWNSFGVSLSLKQTDLLYCAEVDRIAQENEISLQGLQCALVANPPSYPQQMTLSDCYPTFNMSSWSCLEQYWALTLSHYKTSHQSMKKSKGWIYVLTGSFSLLHSEHGSGSY